ncbi:hypothetical protein QJS10_CPB21g00555 [Acorus calamus]|uniref:F-box associated domain-containing protein n=1 Tax=Acorus calamus TaxID=4465 RepID=A0AAV9C5Y2_ACOCL|nr:hypothetical protein QJS10_CPB21g00555 [Acorus calamus]
MTEFDIWMSMDNGGIEWTKVYSFNADLRFRGLWSVCSVSAVLGSDDLKRLVLHAEVVEGDGEMRVVWVLCERDVFHMIELSDKRRWSMELKFSMGYLPRLVKEHVDSLISWHA